MKLGLNIEDIKVINTKAKTVHKMNNKITLPIVIILVALFVLLMAYIGDNPDAIDHSGEKMSFNVSAGYWDMDSFINSTHTLPRYKDCDPDTIKWMESLGDKRVLTGEDAIVVMSTHEAEKIPEDPGITDAFVYNHFKAKVIESRSLGKDYPTVYHVENVEFTGQEVIGNGLA